MPLIIDGKLQSARHRIAIAIETEIGTGRLLTLFTCSNSKPTALSFAGKVIIVSLVTALFATEHCITEFLIAAEHGGSRNAITCRAEYIIDCFQLVTRRAGCNALHSVAERG